MAGGTVILFINLSGTIHMKSDFCVESPTEASAKRRKDSSKLSTSSKNMFFSNKNKRFLCKMNFAERLSARFDGINCFWGQNCLLMVSEHLISFMGWSRMLHFKH